MKIRFASCFIILVASVISFQGCINEDINSEPALMIILKDPTDLTETSFIANWSVNRYGIRTTKIEISLKSDFSDILKTVTLDDPVKTYQLIGDLKGATTYYHRIQIALEDGTSGTSNVKSLMTSYFSENVDVTTIDGINIAGKICYLKSNTLKTPGIIFMGEGGLPNLWRSEETFNNLVAMGYICYIFDWRGQGQSDYFPPLPHIDSLDTYLNNYYKKDLETCDNYLKNHTKVDSTKIALAGASLGATMSLVGNSFNHIKASVAISSSKHGLVLDEPLKNVLYIVCEDDDSSLGIDYSEDAEDLYQNFTASPKRLIVLSGSSHGLDVLGLPGSNQEVVDWITTRFAD